MTTPTVDLSELRALLERIGVGSWGWMRMHKAYGRPEPKDAAFPDPWVVVEAMEDDPPLLETHEVEQGPEAVQLACAAVNALPALLARAEALEGAANALEGALWLAEKWADGVGESHPDHEIVAEGRAALASARSALGGQDDGA